MYNLFISILAIVHKNTYISNTGLAPVTLVWQEVSASKIAMNMISIYVLWAPNFYTIQPLIKWLLVWQYCVVVIIIICGGKVCNS